MELGCLTTMFLGPTNSAFDIELRQRLYLSQFPLVLNASQLGQVAGYRLQVVVNAKENRYGKLISISIIDL